MNKRCFNAGAVFFLLALMMISGAKMFAQRIVDVQAGYGTLGAAIDADSTNRKANPNTIYRVHRGTSDSVYYLTKTLTSATPLRIESAGTGALPTILAATQSDGSAISPLISAKADFTLKGVAINGVNTLGAIVDRVVRIQASPVRVLFDSCQVTWASQSFLRVDNTNARIFLKNCRVSNVYSDWANARVVDNRGITIDTLSMEGCSFYRIAYRVYRDGGGILTYGYFNHNTFTEIADAIFGLGSTKSVTFTNNLAVNCGFLGKGKSANTRLISMTALASGQSAYVANNVFYSDSTTLIAAYKTVSDTITTMAPFADTLLTFMSAAGTTSSNIISPVTFTMPPNNIVKAIKIDSIAKWYWRNPGTLDASIIKVDSIYKTNLAYNTSAQAYTFGSDGKPAGATEWFGSIAGPTPITSNGTGGGLWNAASTWVGGAVPKGNETITIASGDAVIINTPVTITGTLVKKSTAKDSTATGGSLTFGNGGVYQHDVDGGTFPTATWGTGSTCLVTGAATAGTAPANASQNFYNFTWNTPAYSGTAINLAWANTTIGGDLRVINSNNTQLRLTSPSAPHAPGHNLITINGSLFVDSSTAVVGLNGSSTVDTMSLIIKGNLVSKGTLTMGGSGLTTTWYVMGNISFLGGSFAGTSSRTDTLAFAGTTKQTFSSTLASMSQVRALVLTGAIVDLDTFRLGTHSQQSLTVQAGATLISGHPFGVAGNANSTAGRFFSKQASFTYDGVVAQADTALPDTVKNLTINNPAGFTLSRATVVTGTLNLQAGTLDNSVFPVTIAAGGNVVKTNGRTKVGVPGWPITSVTPQEGSLPLVFGLSQNYPNPFNPSTQISYSLPHSGNVKLVVYDLYGREIAALVNGVQSAGAYQVRFDARGLASGTYFYRLSLNGNLVTTKKMLLLK